MDWDEAFNYRPGLRVELKEQPGVCDTIASYEADMVPPIWLVHNPIPRYPHELRVIQLALIDSALTPQGRAK
jgi:hypothetical protein